MNKEYLFNDAFIFVVVDLIGCSVSIRRSAKLNLNVRTLSTEVVVSKFNKVGVVVVVVLSCWIVVKLHSGRQNVGHIDFKVDLPQ